MVCTNLMRYFITFACHGGHLHGDESGSVDRDHNLFGGRSLEADPTRTPTESRRMNQPTYELMATAVRSCCKRSKRSASPRLESASRACAE